MTERDRGVRGSEGQEEIRQKKLLFINQCLLFIQVNMTVTIVMVTVPNG